MMGGMCRPSGLQKPSWKSFDHFGAASYETQKLEGHWRHGGVIYRDNLVRLVVDVPDTPQSREWMKDFKGRWKTRLEQLELWMVSYLIEVE